VLRRVKRELIAGGGTRQLRESVGVGETAGKRTRVVRPSTLEDNHKEARLRREAQAISCEGKTLKEESQERCGLKKGRKL
jgi:hypothetical protein